MAVKKGKAKAQKVEMLTGFLLTFEDGGRKLCEAGEVLTLDAAMTADLLKKGVAKKVK